MEAVIKVKFEDRKEALKACKTLNEGAMEDIKTKLEIKTLDNLLEVKIQAESISALRAVVNSVIRDLKTIIEIKEALNG